MVPRAHAGRGSGGAVILTVRRLRGSCQVAMAPAQGRPVIPACHHRKTTIHVLMLVFWA